MTHEYNYYMLVMNKTHFWEIMGEFVAKGCDFKLTANCNNRPGKFVSCTFWVRDVGCTEYDIIKRIHPTFGQCDPKNLAVVDDVSQAVEALEKRGTPSASGNPSSLRKA